LAVFGVNQARVTELNHDQIVGRQSEYAPIVEDNRRS
jgi:hypothetical protein